MNAECTIFHPMVHCWQASYVHTYAHTHTPTLSLSDLRELSSSQGHDNMNHSLQ